MKERRKERKRAKLGSPHVSQREREREEELGLRGTLFHSQSGLRRRRKKAAKKRAEREGSVSWDCLLVERGEDAQAVAGRAVWVFALWIRSHDSLLCPARLPGPGYSPQKPPSFFLSTPRCPLSLQPHPLPDPACFRSPVSPLPWSCGGFEDEREREAR